MGPGGRWAFSRGKPEPVRKDFNFFYLLIDSRGKVSYGGGVGGFRKCGCCNSTAGCMLGSTLDGSVGVDASLPLESVHLRRYAMSARSRTSETRDTLTHRHDVEHDRRPPAPLTPRDIEMTSRKPYDVLVADNAPGAAPHTTWV